MFDVRDPQPDPVWTIPYPPHGKVLVDAVFVAKVRELVSVADGYPELNMSNYDADDVSCLNMWGFEVAKRRDELAAILPTEGK